MSLLIFIRIRIVCVIRFILHVDEKKMTIKSFELPIKTVSEANSTEHWTKKAKRHKQQAFFVRMAYTQFVVNVEMPCTITMTRCSIRETDSDNLQISMKWIRDELSQLVFPDRSIKTYLSKRGRVVEVRGREDSDPQITWLYKQEKRKKYGVIIEFEF